MTKIRFIGDTHGNMDAYKEITSDCEKSIQVGDMGVGFTDIPVLGTNHTFIRGNHDDPTACKVHPRWIPDGSYWKEARMMFVGGAYSIDWMHRKEGVSWWQDEELSIMQLNDIINKYNGLRPEIMVTHNAPLSTTLRLFPHLAIGNGDRTSQALQAMLEIHEPKLWIFGHWHLPKNEVIGKTRFLCLDINQWADININTNQGEQK